MRKIILLAACLLTLAGCSKEQISSRPCEFDVKITDLKGDKIRFTITPSNPEAYYAYRLEPEYWEPYRLSGDALLQIEMEDLINEYKLFDLDKNPNVDFADAFCYQEQAELVELFLDRRMNYKLVVFQVNPWRMEGLGTPKEVYFRTPDVEFVDLHFNLDFEGDVLRIHPSDPDATYYWDYEEVRIVDSEYNSPISYYHILVDMYEQYGFMDSRVSRGDNEWVFPRDDKSLAPGRECYLVLAGYRDGEINSEKAIVKFVWSPGASAITEWIWPSENEEEE